MVLALESIPPEEVGNRSGRQRGLGYIEPSQAVWDLLEKTVQPYLQDIVRRAGLGMTDAALDLGLGMIAGLYECRLARDDGSVLAWAPADEATPELASEVMSTLGTAGVTVPVKVLDELCPEWDLAGPSQNSSQNRGGSQRTVSDAPGEEALVSGRFWTFPNYGRRPRSHS